MKAKSGVAPVLLLACAVAPALPPAAVRAQPSDPVTPAVAEQRGHERMVAALREVADRTQRQKYATLREYRARFATMPDAAPADQRLLGHIYLGTEEFAHGTLEAAIEHLEAAYGSIPPAQEMRRPTLDYYLGLAYMRLGEHRNCRAQRTAAGCLFPPREQEQPAAEEAWRKAIDHLEKLAAATPKGTPKHLAARWLLNISAMRVGDYPDGVPAAELIAPELLASAVEFPRFPDVAPDLGLDTFDLAGGAIVDDFNGDGLLDIVTSTLRESGRMHFFTNEGDGTFTERAANLDGITGGLNMVQADYDNDGDPDVLVLRGAWLEELGRHPNSLLRNNGDNTFTDVTFAAGLGEVHYPTQAGAWADYDADGDLDLYIGNETEGDNRSPCQLFRNNGDGSFTDVARGAGVENFRFAKSVAWGDYDADGDPDLYVSNMGEENRLYRNSGDGTFTDVASRLGVTLPLVSFVAWFWDFDNDSVLDLYVTSYPDAPNPDRLALVVASYLGLPTEVESAALYRSDGRGGFVDVAEQQGVTLITMPMGSNYGDLDNDGFLDFYLGTGFPSHDGKMPNVLYWNRRGRGFADVTAASGLGHLQKGHGVAFADLDNDGDQDVFEQMGGFLTDDGFANALYENPGTPHGWLKVRLVGTRSNRGALGARIRADIADGDERRSIYRTIGSGGSFGANPLTEHIGVGGAERIDVLEVFWPTTGITQTFSDVAVGQTIEITEGSEEYRVLPERRFGLGGAGPGAPPQ